MNRMEMRYLSEPDESTTTTIKPYCLTCNRAILHNSTEYWQCLDAHEITYKIVVDTSSVSHLNT